MAVSSASTVLLPSDCFLHPESDDEESFVVLGHSLPPESMITVKNEPVELINASAVEHSLKLTTSSLELLNNSTPSLPSMPKVDDQELKLTSYDQNHNGGECIATTHSSVDLSPDEVQQKVDLLIEENMKLKETLHQNNLAMKKQYETLVVWQEEVMAVHASHRQKFADIKKYVEKLKLENVDLTATLKSKDAENSVLIEETKNLKSNQEMAAAKEKIDIKVLKSSFDNLTEFELEAAKKKVLDLEDELIKEKFKVQMQNRELEKYSPNLLEECNKLKLMNEQATIDLNKQRKESEALQKILLEEIKSLKEQLSKTSTAKEFHTNIEEQLMASQMHITKLELLRNEDRNVINLNEEKILQLEKQVEEMTVDLESLPAIHVQLDLYKSDFEAEQQAKSALGAEKQKIAEDLFNLQRRNQKLLEEVERLRGNNFVVVEAQASAPQNHHDFRHDFRCPKCTRKFVSYNAVQEHVDTCIIDGQF